MSTAVFVPGILYYNCQEPHKILCEEIVRVRPGKHTVSGVSMSNWSELGSHGPFKIAFKQAPWFKQFKPCEYDPPVGQLSPYWPLHRNPMFKDECEWWSPTAVRFVIGDVLFVKFMTNAPCVLSKKRLYKIQSDLRLYFPRLYVEERVNDPYLQRGEHV